MPPLTPERLEAAYRTTLETLLAERHPDGYWVGELSTSALSTATAVMALHLVKNGSGAFFRPSVIPAKAGIQASRPGMSPHLIVGGLDWLAAHQNEDGGWGDTVKSVSNISTTMLCRAALHLTGTQEKYADTLGRCENWLFERYGKTPQELAEAVRARYGKDRTFAVPILTTCALAGLVNWKEVPPLPFELACFPQSWFRLLRLHVVSYALPALIAIGRCVYQHRPPWNPFTRIVRWLSKKRSLQVLEKIQPSNGGFLEATPLTSFVTLSLAACGLAHHPVAQKGAEFIVNSVREDGSWPIDTNLSTWVTTLSVNALAAAGELENLDKKEELVQWLLDQQYKEKHPYTRAEPGGWAWTPLPGGVPDADDTPGALLALNNLEMKGELQQPSISSLPSSEKLRNSPMSIRSLVNLNLRSAELSKRADSAGICWLLRLKNHDGGWPTFCRGWGHLPFDRSGSDLTAHVLRAISAMHFGADTMAGLIAKRIPRICSKSMMGITRVTGKAIDRGLEYLAKTQRPDGSWLPLWFGNQHAPDDINPTYGTARVLAAYRDLDIMNSEPAQKGIAWLLANQNEDGGWGGCKGTPSSMEETGLAVEILLDAKPQAAAAVNKGLLWLVEQVEVGGLQNAAPIGFYFAKLWYFEKLYPVIFTLAALGKARDKVQLSGETRV